jgi:hypothetical protein
VVVVVVVVEEDDAATGMSSIIAGEDGAGGATDGATTGGVGTIGGVGFVVAGATVDVVAATPLFDSSTSISTLSPIEEDGADAAVFAVVVVEVVVVGAGGGTGSAGAAVDTVLAAGAVDDDVAETDDCDTGVRAGDDVADELAITLTENDDVDDVDERAAAAFGSATLAGGTGSRGVVLADDGADDPDAAGGDGNAALRHPGAAPLRASPSIDGGPIDTQI